MKRTIVALIGAALLLLAPPAAPAPKIPDRQYCSIFADVALTSAALARQGIEREKVDAAFAEIYSPQTSDARELMRLLTDAGFRAAVAGTAPGDFARAVMYQCVRTGDLDSLLGTRL